MSDQFGIETIHSMLKTFELFIKEHQFKNDQDEYIDIKTHILRLESEISRLYNSGEISRTEAKVFKKRIKRLILPFRQFVYSDIKIPDQKINFSEKKEFSANIEKKTEKEKNSFKSSFKSPFGDFGCEDSPVLAINETKEHLGESKTVLDQTSFHDDNKSCMLNTNDDSINISDKSLEKLNPLGSGLIEWHEIYPELPFIIADEFQNFFLTERDLVDIFKYLFSRILWAMLKLKYSDALNRGLLLDDVESEMFTKNGVKIEYPVEALNKLNKISDLKNGGNSRMMPVKIRSQKRKEFICRTYLFRHCVLIPMKENDIPNYVEYQWNKVEKDIDKFAYLVREIINNGGVGGDRLTTSDFKEFHFPDILRRLRNVESHAESIWFKTKKFPKDEFKKTCLPSMKGAMIEWLYSERWLLELTVGKKIGEIEDYTYFSTDKAGKNIVRFSSNNKSLIENDDEEFVIDLKEKLILFPYKNLKGR